MRTLDADKYRLNVPNIKNFTLAKTDAERLDSIKTLAITTSVPIIIVACYIGELYGFSEQLETIISGLCKFYRIDEVLNVLGRGHVQTSNL